ncbi:MAG: AhpC/TSA family protein [Bacteroidales bacterium]|nr:AhpC/TSA family protein [Bacteroidales bacterium]
MKRSSIIAFLLILAACTPKAVIEGTLKETSGAPVVVKLMDVDRYQVLDTLRTSADGKFSYSMAVEKGQPQFVDLYYGEYRIASLLLQQGDKIKVVSDTLGAYTVSGSDECRLLQKVQADYFRFLYDLGGLTSLAATGENLNGAISRHYIDYYRGRIAYVMSHSHSLTVVPVLLQQVEEGVPVFSQATDGMIFRNIADSLKMDYPESKYVKAIEKEAERRLSLMELDTRIMNAPQVGFPDIELPDMDAKVSKLSNVEGKVVMVYFWATTAELNMFNLETLIPVYEKYHGKGLEIYAVSLDVDKTEWAAVVRNQKHPWVNVCDIRGIASPYIGLWGVQTLPTVFFIIDGEIDPNANVRKPEDIDRYLAGKLK